MSGFFSEKYKKLVPYTPGEQPGGMKYIKLNTNESPFPPSPTSIKLAAEAAARLELYPDPECRELTEKMSETLGVAPSQVLMTNGSDEILNFAFMAFCDKEHPAFFCDITYGFYSVFAELNGVPYTTVPLKEDFSVDADAFKNCGGTVFLANPNAPTGLALPLSEIEEIVKSNPHNVVVIDEAYVDFGGESAVSLVDKYENLLVTQTFSKSRSMAGARLGFGVACEELIRDLNTVKYSTNPYNINRMTMAAGIGTLIDADYTERNIKTIIENREYATAALRELGFEVIDSKTNFVFARHSEYDGEKLYLELKSRGILVRHFTSERIKDYNRITVGTREQMERLIFAVKEIL